MSVSQPVRLIEDHVITFGEHNETTCRVRIYKPSPDVYIVVATQLYRLHTTGGSIVNNSEQLATLLRKRHFPRFKQLIWFDHYPHLTAFKPYVPGTDPDEFLTVEFEWEGMNCTKRSKWHDVIRAEIETLIGAPLIPTEEGYIPEKDDIYSEQKLFMNKEFYHAYKLIVLLVRELKRIIELKRDNTVDFETTRHLLLAARAIFRATAARDSEDLHHVYELLLTNIDAALADFGWKVDTQGDHRRTFFYPDYDEEK